MKKFIDRRNLILIGVILSLILSGSIWRPIDLSDRASIYSRNYEFEYFGWTVNALLQKVHLSSLAVNPHLDETQKRTILRDLFQLQNEISDLTQVIETALADPEKNYPQEKISSLLDNLSIKEKQYKQLAILSEGIVQDYVKRAINELGITPSTQPLPPVLYHVTDLPKNLIISPRNIIRQEKSISLRSNLTPLEITDLEEKVESITDYSALVVNVGGVSTYPAMVIKTASLPFLFETVAHEWTHHYLFFHPLGFNYTKSPELRTMNETTASIAGKEISDYIIRRFFNDLMQPQQPYETINVQFSSLMQKPVESFDFQKEMYLTRQRVDTMLAQDKIEEAESYMEDRRLYFWENGYPIRKLNQAYFAFHGAYADKPFSAAGADPVGEDVRLLRGKSLDLAEFLYTIRRLSSYASLRDLVESY